MEECLLEGGNVEKNQSCGLKINDTLGRILLGNTFPYLNWLTEGIYFQTQYNGVLNNKNGNVNILH